MYQAGTLSGNPIAMAAGLAQLRELERRDGWAALEKTGAAFESRALAAIRGLPCTFQRIGSMFCLYFREQPVLRLSDAMGCDRERFAKFFHHCLGAGVYFAPSQFEAGFLSLAHADEDIDATARVLADGLKIVF